MAACRGIADVLAAVAFFLILDDAKLFLEQTIKCGARVGRVAWCRLRTVLGKSHYR